MLYAQLFLPRVMVMYLIAGSAFLFYVTKIPERYFPGESFSSVCVCVYEPEVGSWSVKLTEKKSEVTVGLLIWEVKFYFSIVFCCVRQEAQKPLT